MATAMHLPTKGCVNSARVQLVFQQLHLIIVENGSDWDTLFISICVSWRVLYCNSHIIQSMLCILLIYAYSVIILPDTRLGLSFFFLHFYSLVHIAPDRKRCTAWLWLHVPLLYWGSFCAQLLLSSLCNYSEFRLWLFRESSIQIREVGGMCRFMADPEGWSRYLDPHRPLNFWTHTYFKKERKKEKKKERRICVKYTLLYLKARASVSLVADTPRSALGVKLAISWPLSLGKILYSALCRVIASSWFSDVVGKEYVLSLYCEKIAMLQPNWQRVQSPRFPGYQKKIKKCVNCQPTSSSHCVPCTKVGASSKPCRCHN